MSFHSLLAFMASDEKSVVIQTVIPLYMICHFFSLPAVWLWSFWAWFLNFILFESLESVSQYLFPKVHVCSLIFFIFFFSVCFMLDCFSWCVWYYFLSSIPLTVNSIQCCFHFRFCTFCLEFPFRYFHIFCFSADCAYVSFTWASLVA